ncbi:MAG: 2-oxo acid dehydrogenase subunit E2 [Gaiella sp.]|nr:2-oxo acid dehydrogenase subunit E2 [Gaiella sp.]
MATDVKLPNLGQGMESGVIVRWLKSEGETVAKGDPLYELDTDKVTQEVESEVDGVLEKIVVPEGEVAVGATVAIIGDNGAAPGGAAEAPAVEPPVTPEPAEERRAAPEQAAPQPPPSPAGDGERAEAPEPPPAAAPSDGARIKASPLARRIARERGVELLALRGTGPEGRILAGDVEQAAAGAPAAPAAPSPAPRRTGEVEVVKLTSIRKTIAKRLTEAWSAPVFQLGVSAEMTEVLALREQLVARMAEGDAKPTVNDILVKLAAVALTRHPAVNATFTGDEIHRHPAADVGIAVAAPQGLVVPVIRDAGRLTVREIASTRADLVTRARDSKLTLEDLGGGTFTISNLGMFGVEQFTAVLNPPQVAILAIGAVKDEPVVRDGELDVAPILRMVLTCDHRAIDGADGAQYLQTLVALVEQPALGL